MTSTLNNKISNKNRQITYEELMNSHFMKYPSHSRIVHIIFNPFVVAAIILIATTAYVKIVDGDWTFAIMVGLICSLFMSMKIFMATMNMSGHGVGLVKKGKLSVLGLSSAAVVILTLILLFIVGIILISYTAPGDGFERVQQLGVSMLFGFIMSILSWRFHTYYTMWYGSEYDARMEFRNKGNSEEEIDEKIKQLKKKDILL